MLVVVDEFIGTALLVQIATDAASNPHQFIVI